RWTSRATTSAPAVSTSSSSSSRLASTCASVWFGSATATRTIFSRTVRSMSVAPSASWYGLFTSDFDLDRRDVGRGAGERHPARGRCVELHGRRSAVHLHGEFPL